ncbi:hypothetical protein BBP40_007465 [Aspergillus hancockii]|nr:hypothetical protein BBP40_007465 [Aspergillus hancockii]
MAPSMLPSNVRSEAPVPLPADEPGRTRFESFFGVMFPVAVAVATECAFTREEGDMEASDDLELEKGMNKLDVTVSNAGYVEPDDDTRLSVSGFPSVNERDGFSVVGIDAVTCDVLNVVGPYRGKASTTGVVSVLKIELSEGIGVIEKGVGPERLVEDDAAAVDLRGTLVHRFPSVTSEPERERRAPSKPTSLDFPAYKLPDSPEGELEPEASLRQVHGILASIRKPQDISPDKFKALNLKVDSDLPVSRIVCKDGPAFFPPLPWEDTSPNSSPLTEDGSPILMENGNPYPPKERFDVLKDELLLENDDAFREVARLPPREGRQRVRVTQARKFWTGLERMAQYWDTSLDNYYKRPAISKEATKGESGGKLQTDDEAPPSEVLHKSDIQMDIDNLPKSEATEKSPKDQGDEKNELVEMYTGRRIGAGHEMPEDIRDETIRALTEMAAWPFGCQVALPIVPPRLSIKSLLFPVRQTFEAARSPQDRQLARSGVMEGPVFVAQCRPETCFRAPQDVPGTGFGEVCDLFREVGGMLLAAQERARQGMTEVKPGEGKWWATTPRWGGAPNDAVGDSGNLHNGEEKPGLDNGNSHKRSKYEHPFLASRRAGSAARKLSNCEKWKFVHPGPGLWDKRMRYIQIGKDLENPFDDIYMLSSVNHHLAILHLRVHRRYIDIITSGESDFPPDSDTTGQPWHMLQLRRTKWYDLFDADERLEVFKGIWTIFHHLLRPT